MANNSDSDTESDVDVKKILPVDNTLAIDDIKNIRFQDINDDYCYGKYGDFKVIIMKKNNYINATHLCKSYNKETKEFSKWKRNASSQDLIEGTAKGLDMKASELLISITGGRTPLIRGTYVHYEILADVAR